MKNGWFTAVMAGLVVAAVAGAETITVCLDGSCDFNDIQAAIDSASDGDVIEIGAGTYYPAATINTLGKAVTLRGEFGKVGIPTTMIDGQDSIRVLICQSKETDTTIFERLVIQNGAALDNRGGGMYNRYSSPTLIDCIFTGNDAGTYGGGMRNYQSSPILIGCTFTDNSSHYGGAMSNWESSPELERCSFTGNMSGYYGGAMANHYSSPALTDCTFTDNSTESFGGAISHYKGLPTLTRCTLSGNSAGQTGGGMYNNSGSPTLTDTVVCGNTPNPMFPENSYVDGGGNTIAEECPDECPADLNGNGYVDGADLTVILGNWGLTDIPADLNNDGLVDGADLTIVLAFWGPC